MAVSSSAGELEGLKLPEACRFLMSGARKSAKGGGHALFGRLEEQFDDLVDHLMICPGGEADRDLELIEWVQNYARLLGFQGARRRIGVMILPSEDQTVVRELTGPAGQKKILPLILAAGGRKRNVPLSKKSLAARIRRTAELFDAFNQLSGRPTPYTSFDTMDYLEVLTAGGCTVMGMAEAEPSADRHAFSRAVRKALDSMMPAGAMDLRQAKAGACLVVGGREMMAETAGLQDAILYGFDVLAALTGRATIHRGIYEDDNPSLRIYTMFSGLPAPGGRQKSRK